MGFYVHFVVNKLTAINVKGTEKICKTDARQEKKSW